MHKTRSEARALVEEILPVADSLPPGAAIVVFPSFTALSDVAQACAGSRLEAGAQDLHPGREGAFTGAVSARQVLDAGATWALVGHSERRHVFGESDLWIQAKLSAAVEHGLRTILCVGETEIERERGATEAVLQRQLELALARLDPRALDRVAVAYEPVWAIGTGKTAEDEQLVAAHRSIRRRLTDLHAAQGSTIPILYGGSVRPDNAGALAGLPEVAGLLVGGASLQAESFNAISREASAAAGLPHSP